MGGLSVKSVIIGLQELEYNNYWLLIQIFFIFNTMIKEDKRAKQVKEYFRRWSDAKKDWEAAAREDVDFYLGNHFSPEETDTLEERNQSAMPMDRL